MLTSINESNASNLTQILSLVNGDYDAILTHISIPFCLALKMAELSHRDNTSTKIVLLSGTRADRQAICGFFDGLIHPTNDLTSVAEKIQTIVNSTRRVISNEKEIRRRIVAIFNSSAALKADYNKMSGLRHKKRFTFQDYQLAIDTSMTYSRIADDSKKGVDVFLSYATKDSPVAEELADILSRHGLTCYMAGKSLTGGELWQEEIRNALLNSRELLLLLTPNSIKSSWVMIEAGAAWIQKKTINPYILFVDTNDIPGPIGNHQATGIMTEQDKNDLAKQIKARIH
jgi:hypothetical protein